jgi:hypothetical protein
LRRIEIVEERGSGGLDSTFEHGSFGGRSSLSRRRLSLENQGVNICLALHGTDTSVVDSREKKNLNPSKLNRIPKRLLLLRRKLNVHVE